MEYSDNFLTMGDGVKIYYRKYNHISDKKPIICLAGLTRNSKDFHDFACYRSNKYNDKIIAIDMAGRGRSDYADSVRYELHHEVSDIMAVMRHENIINADFVGTSRGGMQAAMIAGLYPEFVDKVILNDVGVKIPLRALSDIAILFNGTREYHDNFDIALSARRSYDRGQTKNISLTQEITYLHNNYKIIDGKYIYDYDKNGIGIAFKKSIEFLHEISDVLDLTILLNGLINKKTLLLHGENSDILTDDIALETMDILKFGTYLRVRDRGHVPFLDEPEVKEQIDIFLG